MKQTEKSSEKAYTVAAIFWARISRHLVVENACFGMRITLGVVFIHSLVLATCVRGRLRSGSGEALSQRV